MKRIKLAPKSIGLIAFLVVLSWTNGAAQQIRHERKITENFTTNASSTFAIYNKYGKVHINTHSGKEINVVVTVVGKGSTAEQAKNIAEGFPVNISRGNNIIFKSDEKPNFVMKPIGEDIKVNLKKSDYEINYEVNLPHTVPLILYHSFGEAYLGAYTGNLTIQMSYGPLKTDKLTGNDFKNIEVKFGSADIAYVERGKLVVSYSNLNLAGAGDIEFQGKNGSFDLGAIGNIRGAVSYSSFEIASLSKSLEIESRYNSNVKVENISADFSKIALESSYNGADLNFSPGDSFDFDVNTSFGSFNFDRNQCKLSKEIKGNTSASYSGKCGGGSATSKVSIDARYGDVTFR